MGLGIDVHVDMQNNDVGRSVYLQTHFGMGMGGGWWGALTFMHVCRTKVCQQGMCFSIRIDMSRTKHNFQSC